MDDKAATTTFRIGLPLLVHSFIRLFDGEPSSMKRVLCDDTQTEQYTYFIAAHRVERSFISGEGDKTNWSLQLQYRLVGRFLHRIMKRKAKITLFRIV